MRKEKSTISKIFSWLFIIILLFAIYKLFGIFKLYYFNEFIKAEATIGISRFTRDVDIKYNEGNSYKIVSPMQNDAAFYKEIEVEPNTVYKISCKVKTENVVPSGVNTDGGANISIIEQPEISKSIVGTTDWQEIELLFNSKKRTKLRIGFRLGGNTGTAMGTAWFSDFKLEKGIKSEDSNWKFACFIFKNVDVEINGDRMNFSMTTSDIENVKNNMQRFKTTCNSLSDGKMQVSYDIYQINDPITTISYSDEHGYYFDPYDINHMVEDAVLENEYDYIFATVRMGTTEKEIPVKDWIGLR